LFYNFRIEVGVRAHKTVKIEFGQPLALNDLAPQWDVGNHMLRQRADAAVEYRRL
jgi:hypothetical protein